MTTPLSALNAATNPSIAVERPVLDVRTHRLLHAPVVPLLIRLALPNVAIMVAQASTGLIETWWVSRLGTDALAGMALVFPAVMLMTTISAGALGGAISSAVARALGAGHREDADALVLHAVVVNILFGLAFSALFLALGTPIYRLMGGVGGALEAALIYSTVVFFGNIFVWIMNGLASVIRGTGNMAFPAIVTCVGVVFLVPVSPLLIFGWGPVPVFGVAGGGLALVAYYVAGSIAMGWYIGAGHTPVRFRWEPLRWRLLSGILRVGALSSINFVQTNLVIAGTTALVASSAGVAAVAGFGTGVRLEYLLIPLIFGIGAPMVAMVGTNIGAGQAARARHIALTGAALAFLVTEAIGLAAALFPELWMNIFTHDPVAIAAGSAYLRIVGPFYGFFGLGLSLYFASQGAGRLGWPIVGGLLRLFIAVGGGALAIRLGGSLAWIFAVLAAALLAYGITIFSAVRFGRWLEV